ncbi:class II aldolase/adducin family protein [Polycladomyces subterraneus]|uniref:Class II aldolase/adducin family protein n=1 Tax=Polycladomyces subterraneus TaxID=1016997 RepID=A0ABT8IQJ9_9BACL|nr:class II aldolase/adducin family protein [Polycladomyces subterraneus]MDN4594692.1 class II aldolase/adducin family protein [Polycladomyces subterraneus]
MKAFCMVGDWRKTPSMERFADGLRHVMKANGYEYIVEPRSDVQLVFNFVDPLQPRHFHREGKGTFVVTVAENDQPASDILKAGYPILVRSLGNMMIYLDASGAKPQTYFITLEQGCYPVRADDNEERFYQRVFERLRPLATAKLVIDNRFDPDLPEELWQGDQVTEGINRAGKWLDGMNLLPTPFPLEELVSPRELRHIKRLYGIGGLSYGNLSARKDQNSFWMSASGVNKANLERVGQDILLIKGYDDKNQAMEISVPPHVKPRRASVDAIEHWMIYTEHPQVGAIVHIHAWMDGVPSTEINYPCGTLELAEAVAEHIRRADDPSRAVVGLKNHGLTITGRDLEDIFERIDGKIIPQVPMS